MQLSQISILDSKGAMSAALVAYDLNEAATKEAKVTKLVKQLKAINSSLSGKNDSSKMLYDMVKIP